MPSLSDLHVGDQVQVRPGTTDQSLYGNTGVLIASRYTTSGNLFMTITQKGLKSNPSADYLVLSYGSVVITATKASYIGSNYICKHKSQPAAPTVSTPVSTPRSPAPDPVPYYAYIAPIEPFVTVEAAMTWRPSRDSSDIVGSSPITIGAESVPKSNVYPDTTSDKLPVVSETNGSISAGALGTARRLTTAEAREIGSNNILKSPITREPSFSSEIDLNTLIDGLPSKMQNNEQYPVAQTLTSDNTWNFIPRKYDYSTQNNPFLKGSNKSLRDALGEFRTLYGLPIHGDKSVAKYMKYFLYNRFKVPDTNLAFNRSYTHVFFTRPDLNILKKVGSIVTISDQCTRHTESAMLWHKNPELFKLLVDKKHCDDTNNFNMLLSNQVNSFNVINEELNTVTHGKSWHGYEMNYGSEYTARSAGQVSIGFNDTRDLDVMHLIKLWMTYIDNVYRGAWSPSYTNYGNRGGFGYSKFYSHVYTRTLDYPASIYFIKVAENGEDIIYWSKYYGVYPISNGAEAMSWQLGQRESVPNLNITFRYAMKRDMNPINLVEFNAAAGTRRNRKYISNYNPDVNGSTHPYVGTPYIETLYPDVATLKGGSVAKDQQRAWLKLRFDQQNIETTGMTYKDMFYDTNS